MFKPLLSTALLLTMVQAQALEVHEWGTFTSMVNENGEVLDGMSHEEEGLPGFVYGLRQNGLDSLNFASRLAELQEDPTPGQPTPRPVPRPRPRPRPCDPGDKCAFLNETFADVLPYSRFNTTVTQKMETPVIYFYGQKGEKAQVEVKFPEGMISQWFPAASDFNLHLKEFKGGHMTWDVTLKGSDEAVAFPKTTAESIWNPARDTKANPITVNGEEERFIFYRGLGDFSVPLQVLQDNDRNGALRVTLVNHSAQAVPALFYVLSDKSGVKRFLKLRPVSSLGKITFTPSSVVSESNRDGMKAELVAAGLFEDEAESMLKTWDKSYFHTPGERILYVLPNAWTEKILPLTVTPAPSKLVRVLVGRIELLTPATQQKLIGQIKSGTLSTTGDHLLEAKLNGVKSKLPASDIVDRLIQRLK